MFVKKKKIGGFRVNWILSVFTFVGFNLYFYYVCGVESTERWSLVGQCIDRYMSMPRYFICEYEVGRLLVYTLF